MIQKFSNIMVIPRFMPMTKWKDLSIKGDRRRIEGRKIKMVITVKKVRIQKKIFSEDGKHVRHNEGEALNYDKILVANNLEFLNKFIGAR
jgi:hypothetical protein